MAQPTQPTADQHVVDTSTFEAELFWYKNRHAIIVGVAVLVIALVATGIWFINARSQRVAADALLAGSKDAAGWQEVITKYPKSLAAANAYLLLAGSQRDSGDLAASTQTFEKFLVVFPTHPFRSDAQLGVAENLVVAGKDKEGLEKLQELQAQSSSGFAAPVAALLEGRMLMRQGKFVEAQKVFQTLAQTYPSTPPASFADALLQEIGTLLPPPVPAATASPAPTAAATAAP